ncbi:MAG: response regulator [bacterium]
MNNSNKKLLLLVEDDVSISKVLSRFLEQSGFNLLRATDGIYGLKMALENHPDLILLDLIMPHMDGLTFLKELRKDKWGKSVPVMILSNLSNPETEKEAAQYAIKDYIIKTDFCLTDILKKINDIL